MYFERRMPKKREGIFFPSLLPQLAVYRNIIPKDPLQQRAVGLTESFKPLLSTIIPFFIISPFSENWPLKEAIPNYTLKPVLEFQSQTCLDPSPRVFEEILNILRAVKDIIDIQKEFRIFFVIERQFSGQA
jgi:hypothetical protein